MPDERKKRVIVVVGGESSRQVDGSGAAPDVGVPLNDQFPPDPPILPETVVSEEARRRQRRTTIQRSSLWVDLCQLLVANQRESLLRRQSGELVTFQRQRLP